MRSNKGCLRLEDEYEVGGKLFILNEWSTSGPLKQVVFGQRPEWCEPRTHLGEQVFQVKGRRGRRVSLEGCEQKVRGH